MKNNILSLLLAVFATAFLFSSCGGSHEDPSTPSTSPASSKLKNADVNESIEIYFVQLERLAEVFAAIEDKASAQAHGETLQEISATLQASADRLGELDKQDVAQAMASQSQRFMTLQQKLMPELGRISSNPALAKELQDAIRIPSIK